MYLPKVWLVLFIFVGGGLYYYTRREEKLAFEPLQTYGAYDRALTHRQVGYVV